MFTIRNAVLVALMQVGVIVAGVLGAGVTVKAFMVMNAIHFPLIDLLVKYGGSGFILPLAWITLTLLLRQKPQVPDHLKNLAFLSGILLVISLAVFMFYADVTPWMNIMWTMSGDEN